MINYSIHNLLTNEVEIKPFDKLDLDLLFQFGRSSYLDSNSFEHFKSKIDAKQKLDYYIDSNEYLKIVRGKKIVGILGIKILDNKSSLSLVISNTNRELLIISNIIREIVRFLFLDISLDIITFDTNDNLFIDALINNKFNKLDNIYQILKSDYISNVEKLKIYDSSLREIKNEYILRGEEAKYPNIYRGVCDIITYNTKTNRFLVTRRAKDKKTNPNMLEVTGGAISYGEDEEDCARRELKEETSIDAKSIKFLYRIHNNTKDRLGYMVLYYVYLAKTDIDEDSLKLQDGETIEYMWLNKTDFINIFKSNDFVKSKSIRLKEALKMLDKEIL